MFIDSHCHLELEEFDKDRAIAIERAMAAGVSRILIVATEEKYFSMLVKIIEGNPSIYGAIGLHPHNAIAYCDGFERTVRQLLSHPKIVGYGEIGLDFYRNHSPKDVQIRVFKKQIKVAIESKLPVIIHSRDARHETLSIVREMGLSEHPFIFHCYSYDVATAKELLDMGAYLSIPGTVTYKNSIVSEVVRQVPLDRILSETDSPFLSPAPHRGKRNEPAYVAVVVEEIARVKNMDIQMVASVLEQNFFTLFTKIVK
jgi:TatD DNase family protein